MLYYRVKKEADQRRKSGKGFDIYVGGELYTPKEVEKQNLNLNYLTPVEVSRKKVYFFFGARFAMEA